MYYVYLSIAGENKISIFEMNADTGKLYFLRDIVVSGGPGPLAVDPTQKYLYAGIRSTNEISSFQIDPDTGNLSLINTISLEADPCYMSTDQKGRFLLSAYYRAGVAAVHRIHPKNGAVERSPVEQRATAEHAHCIMTDASNRFVFVPHTVSPNVIFQFIFDAELGTLTPNVPPQIIPEPGAGPRHYCYHPNKDVAYFSNEQGCSVTAYHFNSAAGTLSPFQTLSTLPRDFSGSNTCAQIHITPDGKFLYVSNRGHDSIAIFSINALTGELTGVGQQPTEPTPRTFNVDPTGNFLFAAGQGSGRLASYRIDSHRGTLFPLETYEIGRNPMWVMVLGIGD
jgi:6-phosphogluconolactonase